MCTVTVVRPFERGTSTASWGQRTIDGELARFLRRFLIQNGGLKYACEPLRVRLIVAMVNIGINKGAMICWGFEVGDHDVSQ
jgi:hypothetical protein